MSAAAPDSIYLIAAHPDWRNSRVTRRLLKAARGVADALTDILKPAGLTPAMLKAGDRYVEDIY